MVGIRDRERQRMVKEINIKRERNEQKMKTEFGWY